MFLYYIPQPNKQQPHNVVLKNPLKKRNWISFHFHLSNWSALFLWDLFTGFISFLLPWSLPAAAKKNISCWKENMKTSLNVNVQRRHWGKKCSRSCWRWYFYQCNDDVEISYLFPTSICFVCLQSNAVFAVKDQNCLDLRNLGLQTFHSWSQEIQKTTNAKNVAIHWKYTAPDL